MHYVWKIDQEEKIDLDDFDPNESYRRWVRRGTPWAPWYVVPASHKWFRNLAIAHTLVDVLKAYKKTWEKNLEERGQRELELLKKIPHPWKCYSLRVSLPRGSAGGA